MLDGSATVPPALVRHGAHHHRNSTRIARLQESQSVDADSHVETLQTKTLNTLTFV